MTLDPAQVVSIRFDYRDHWLTVHCPGCGTRHEAHVPAVMMVITAVCPQCGRSDRLEPQDIAEACARLLPPLTEEEGDEINRTTARLVHEWSRVPEVDTLLRHRGIDLGAGGALRLVPLVVRGLMQASSGAPRARLERP